MFGFGRSANEKAVINLFALQLEAIGLPSRESVQNATKLVDEVLADMRPRGVDPYKSTQGNEYLEREAFMAPHIAAGLKPDDVRTYWNRPLVVVLAEMKMRELINFIVVDAARQRGTDPSAAAAEYKRTFPRYGDPARWDPGEKFNVGLSEADADIYPEFAGRVNAWRNRAGEAEVSRLILKHGTLNAVIRAEIAAGKA